MAVYSRIRSQITTTPSYPNGLVVTGGMSIGTNIDADVPLKVGTVTATGQIGLNLTSNTGAHLQLTDIGNVDMSLGVLDGQSALSFHTGRNRQSNGTELMRLTSSGNVGIGTSSPITLLHIDTSGYAALYLGANNSNGFHVTKESSDNSFNIWSGVFGSGTNRLKISSSGQFTFSSATSQNVATFFYPTAGGYSEISVNSNDRQIVLGQRSSTYSSGDLAYLYTPSATPFAIYTSASERMRISSSGSVGIGTSSPANKLHIAGETAQYPTSLYIAPTGHATSRRAGIAVDNWEWMQDIGGNGTKDFGLYDRDDGTIRVYVGTSGNVGIGTSTPQSLLDLKSFHIGRFTFTAKTFAAGAWYRFLTLPGGYGSALTVYLRQPMGHGILEISIGKATYGYGNTGVVAEIKRKGAYHYNYNISQIRIVDMGTNGDTHLEAYFPAATTDTLDMSWHGLVPTNLAAVPVDMTAGSTTGAGTTKTMVVSDGATASTFQTLLGISTLTTDPLYVKSDGKIGLGTQTPSQKLTITDGNFLISKSSFGGNLLWTQGSTSPQSGVFTWGDGTGWRMDFGTSSSNKLSIYDNATTSIEISDKFYVKNQPIYLYNNVGGIQQTDSGGTARWMMRFDTSNQRIFGDVSAGSGNATYIQSNSNVYLQSGTTPGQAHLNPSGDFTTGREFITSAANGLRINTLMLRNDGENCYFLFGTAGTAGDNWNSLRPLRINNASGWVLIGGEASALTSPLSVGGAVTFAAISISTSTTLGSTHTHVFASGTITITLPTAVGISGRTYWIKRTGTGTITIATTSSQTIDGSASLSISAQYDSYTLVSDGANWYIM